MTENSRAGGERFRPMSVSMWWALIAAGCVVVFSAGAAVDLAVSGTDAPDPVVTQSNLTYTLSITNIGGDPATGVSITNLLPATVSFVSATTTRGSCSNVSGVVYCDWGTVAAQAGGRVTITARPTAPGLISNRTLVGAIEADADGTNNSLTLNTSVINHRTFTSADFIVVEEILSRPATPYPSTITLSGITSAVQKLTVTLNNLSHTGPDDLDILLVGPQGGYVMLMSDGQTTPALTDVIITFDDAAAQPVPDVTGLVSGSYRPANYGNAGPDMLPPPAPQVPYFSGFSNLAVFNRTDPNGQWRLFVFDDEPEAGGWIDGWSLTLSTMEPLANLGVTLAGSPDPALSGDIITYTATITNIGPVAGTGVRLTNQVPSGLEIVGYTISRGSCTNGGGVIRCEIASMNAGTSEQLVVQARALRGGNYTNRIEVVGEGVDAHPTNNVAVQTTVVEPRVDLAVEMLTSRTPALLEQPLIYTLLVTNHGLDTATGVRVTDELPPGVLLVNMTSSQGSCSNQNGIITCNLGSITNRGRATVFLTCRPTVLGPITNIASITSDQVDVNPTNNVAQNINVVEPAADLLLTMTDAPDPVPLGQTLQYSIVVSNRGPSTASNVVIFDALPQSLRFKSAQSTHGACTNDSNSVTCVIGELPMGERALVTIASTATALGTVLNSASVTSQPVDPNTGNNLASVSTLVTPAADLSVAKAGDRELIWEGDRIVYSMVVSNHGPSTATAARLNDLLPEGVRFISAFASAGSCTLQGRTVACTLGDLAPGGGATVTITGAADIPGVITNAATVLANEQDLIPANNQASIVTTVIPRSATISDTSTIILAEAGVAPVYPMMIHVSGLTAAVQRVRVVFPNFSHSYPDDLDMLLVGPGGQSVVLMSDAGGGGGVTNVDLIIDDLALTVLPDGAGLTDSTYRPADYEVAADEFPAPAPPGPYGSNFDVFTGTDPNGTWKLYIVDDTVKDNGVLGGGWRLDIWTRDSMAEVAVMAEAAPELVAVGSNATVTLTVSNGGPGSATGVLLSNVYETNLVFAGAVTSHGSCTNEAGLVQCFLGDIGLGESAVVQITFAVAASGTLSNFVGVTTSSLDFVPSNNTSVVTFTAENPPMILGQPQNQGVTAGESATFEVITEGDPPLSYQWYHNGSALDDETNSVLTISDVQAEALGEYRVEVSNRVGAVWSDVAHLTFPVAPVIEAIADQFTGEDEVLIIPLMISDPDNSMETFVLTALCNDTNLVPTTNMSFVVDGTNFALVIVPGTNQFGTNIVTVTATDSFGLTATQTFTLGVESINDYPVFTIPVGDQVMDEDGSITVRFEVADVETPTNLLIIGATSYGHHVMPNNLLGPWGPGGDPYITLTPAKDRFGTALIEIRVRDEAGVRSTNLFTLTVLPVEDAPTISFIEDTTILEDGELSVSFTVDDVETLAGDLLVSAESSNPDLFTNDGFVLGGTGGSRTLRASPLPDRNGFSQITIFVQDGAGVISSNSFWVTVDPVNDPPEISAIPAIETPMEQTSPEAGFTIGDLETDAENLTLTAISTNTALAPLAGIEFGGSGSNRTVRVTPGAGEFGWTVLRVEVSDPDGGVTTRDFELIVHQTNGPPLILQSPESQVATLGSPVTFKVVATGPGLQYQWLRNGEDLPDQTNRVLAIISVSSVDRGEYQVRVSNLEGSVTTVPVQLMVLEATRILSLMRVGDTVELTFGTVAGQRYFVEFQDLLGTGWTALPEVTGTGEVITAIDPAATGSIRFYRVRVE